MSKEKLDFCLLEGEKVLQEMVVENTTNAIIRSLKGILKEFHLEVSDFFVRSTQGNTPIRSLVPAMNCI